MSGLTIPSTGTIPGLSVSYTPTNTLTGQNYNSGNLYNQSYSNPFAPQQAYADTTDNTLNLGSALSSGGLTVNSTPTSTSTTGDTSGNGGLSYDQRLSAWRSAGNTGDLPVGWNPTPTSPQGISQADLDAAYNPVYGSINDLYNRAYGNKQTYLDAATSPFDALQPDIDQAYQSGLNLNQQQSSQNNSQTQNALSAARQLYNELQQGVQQRFGGTSSAGDFAKAFYGRQLQQNEGQAYNTQGQNQQSLNTQAATLLAQHDNNIKQLNAQKAAALANAQLQFQNKLDSIDQLRLQTDQQKAAAKLDALQQLKATANAINQQFDQFQQNLVLQNQSSLDQLRNGVATAQAYSGQPINLSAINPAFYSQMGGPQGGSNPYMIVGNLNRDKNGNPLS